MSMPNRIALLTDSTCDLPPELARELDIIVVPQVIIWGTEVLRDWIDISAEAFYARLKTDPAHPTTSQPSGADFLGYIQRAHAAGAEEAMLVCVSDELSGTLDSARQAAADAPIPVKVVDSRSASLGLGHQAIAAARARAAGGDLDAMAAATARVRDTLQVIFSVDTLEYLHKGGRIGGAARLIGTALNLKPMLSLDPAVGRVEPVERTRTRRKALERMYETFSESVDRDKPLHAGVIHGADPDAAAAVAARLEQDLHPVELIVNQVSPVVGVHTGPGAIGICAYTGE